MWKTFSDGGDNHINIFIGIHLYRYLTKRHTKEGGSELCFHSCFLKKAKKKREFRMPNFDPGVIH